MRYISFHLLAAFIIFSASIIIANEDSSYLILKESSDALKDAGCVMPSINWDTGERQREPRYPLKRQPPPPPPPSGGTPSSPPSGQNQSEQTLTDVLKKQKEWIADFIKKSTSCDVKWCKLGIAAMMESVNIGFKYKKIFLDSGNKFAEDVLKVLTMEHQSIVNDLIGRIDTQIGGACSDKTYEILESELQRLKKAIEKDACLPAINEFVSIQGSVEGQKAAGLFVKIAPLFLTSGRQCDANWCTLVGEVSKFENSILEGNVQNQGFKPVFKKLSESLQIEVDTFIASLHDIIKTGRCLYRRKVQR